MDMYISLAVALLLTTATVLIKPIAEVFGFARITILQYLVSVLFAVTIIPIKELWKLFINKTEKNKKSDHQEKIVVSNR